ncbi:substrate-binding domain-containing protein [Streptomyces sp. NPDC058665]|uniref:substrate-binding domain-containing protein n=1 Tax=Streptomyces sp. NPDC058665 TaxID=3346586 RepID=UPI0036686951
MNVKSRVRIGALVGATALAIGALAVPAQADPPPGEYRVLAGVGSDTTQDVFNGLGNAVASGDLIASYNATGPAIKTREVNCDLTRPNGSSAGINALRNAVDNNTGCLDFARSSRGVNNDSTTDLTWIPFAKDAVTFAVRGDSDLPTALTTQQLTDIYTCDLDELNGVALTPLLPQAGSGTRSFFLGALGLTEDTFGPCVDDTVQEHNGEELDSEGDIAPYSIAQYIAQGNQPGDVIDRRGFSVLGSVDGAQPTLADGKLNTAFPFNRDVYNVVPTENLDLPNIEAAFVTGDSLVCDQDAVIEEYGFGTVANCGSTVLKGES